MDVQTAITHVQSEATQASLTASSNRKKQEALDIVLKVARGALDKPLATGLGLTYEGANQLRDIFEKTFGRHHIFGVSNYSGHTANGEDAYCVEICEPGGDWIVRIVEYEVNA